MHVGRLQVTWLHLCTVRRGCSARPMSEAGTTSSRRYVGPLGNSRQKEHKYDSLPLAGTTAPRIVADEEGEAARHQNHINPLTLMLTWLVKT